MPTTCRSLYLLLLVFCLIVPATAQDNETLQDKAAANLEQQDDPKQDSDAEEQAEKETRPGLRQINLSGTYVDHRQSGGFDPTQLLTAGGSAQKSFFKLIDFIDELAEDKEYEYVLFDLSAPFSMNSVQLDQLARHLKKLNEAKKTYAWLENAGNAALSVAAACERVVMADFGVIDMPSNSMQAIFFGDAFDLFGVEASIVRAGDFKGAVEPFVNSKMSPHLRQHNLEMLQSLNDTLVQRIARSRGLEKSQVRELQKERILRPQDAVDAGLVDALAPYGSMRDTVEKEIGEDVNWVAPSKGGKQDISFFQLMSEIMSGPSSSKLKKNTIAVIHLNGVIIDGKKKVPGSIVSGPTVEMIEELTQQERVKAAVIRINSPGGSATASEAIRQALLKLAQAKPTVVSMGNVAASGGYWVSCIGTPVFAERGTITGSIGVFSMKISAGALMRRVGVHLENMALDDAANAFSMDQAWDEADVQRMQKIIDQVYDRFLNMVSDCRKMPLSELSGLAGGRVWSGAQAFERNLVDEIGGLDDCLALVAKKAGLGEDYAVAHRPLAGTGLDLGSLLGTGGDDEILTPIPSLALGLLRQSGLDLKLTSLILHDSLRQRGQPTTWLLSPFEFSIK